MERNFDKILSYPVALSFMKNRKFALQTIDEKLSWEILYMDHSGCPFQIIHRMLKHKKKLEHSILLNIIHILWPNSKKQSFRSLTLHSTRVFGLASQKTSFCLIQEHIFSPREKWCLCMIKFQLGLSLVCLTYSSLSELLLWKLSGAKLFLLLTKVYI